MTGGVMFLPVMSDFDTHMKHKFMKKYVGVDLYPLEYSTKNILNGLYIPRALKSGKKKILIILNCS